MDDNSIPDWLRSIKWEDGVSVEKLIAQGFSPTVTKPDKEQFASIWKQRQNEAKWMKNIRALDATTKIVNWLDMSSDEVYILIFGEARKSLIFDARLQLTIVRD